MSLRDLLGWILTNPRVLLIVNAIVYGHYFFMEIVVYNSPSGRIPYPVLIPGAVMLCFLGWYIIEHGSMRFERSIGYALLYIMMFLGTLYFLGLR